MNSSNHARLGLASLLLLAPPLAACDVDKQPIGSLEGETGDGDVDCSPGDASFEYDAPDLNAGLPGASSIDWSCTVTAADMTNGFAVTLDCPNATKPVDIEISASPQIVTTPIEVDDTVRLRYVDIFVAPNSHYLRIDGPDSEHVVTLIDAAYLQAPEELEFEAPLADLDSEVGLCPSSAMSCGEYEPLAVTFDYGGLRKVVDGHIASFTDGPTIDVWVEQAARLDPDNECQEHPESWFRVLIANTQGG